LNFAKLPHNQAMHTERFDQRRADFQKAVTRLEETCAQPESSFLRDSVIQRFEFSWELAWKMLKLRLAYLGVEALNPGDVIRQSLQAGLIHDGNAWTEAQHHRNMTSHTYDEPLSLTVYAFIRSQGVSLLRELADTATGWSE
jgi:nucleotidyltransferase substrate binding protein (TIGR01987 family)